MGADRGHRARGADHLDLAAGDRAADLVLAAERAQVGADALHHVVVAGARRRLLARQALHARLGQRDHAPRHRGHVENLGADAAQAVVAAEHADPAHLGRAAADVDQQAERDLGVEQVLAARQRQPRLLGRVDDLEAEARALLDHGEEILAVAGAAAGLGGNVAGHGDAIALDLAGADGQRMQRALDRIAAQRPAQRHPFAQPDRPGIGIDDLIAVDRCPRHQEPAVVGAEIDGSKSVREPTAVPTSLGGFPGHSPTLFLHLMVTEVTTGGEPFAQRQSDLRPVHGSAAATARVADGRCEAGRWRIGANRRGRLAGGPGFEPRLTGSEPVVLPLNYPPSGQAAAFSGAAAAWQATSRRRAPAADPAPPARARFRAQPSFPQPFQMVPHQQRTDRERRHAQTHGDDIPPAQDEQCSSEPGEDNGRDHPLTPAGRSWACDEAVA